MTDWRTAVLADLGADDKHAFSTGPFGSSISKKYFRDTGVPVIRGSNLSQEVGVRLSDNGLVYVDPEHADRFQRSHVRAGDLVFTCWGTVGQVGLVTLSNRYSEYLISNKQMKMTPCPESVEPLFLYYLLSSPRMVHDVVSQAIGTSIPGFNLGQLKDLVVHLPDLATQRTIAGALGAFDDLIENNRRRIEILEEMARLLYREWFVHFRFPGHEDVEMVDSELGPIPEGWNVAAVSDLGRVVTGSTPPKAHPEMFGSDIPFLTPSDKGGWRYVFPERHISSEGAIHFANKMLPPGSICFTCIGATIGKMAVTMDRTLTNQQINSVVPNDTQSAGFIYQALSSQKQHILSIASGAATPIVNKSSFEKVRVLLPDEAVVAAFDKVETPISGLILNLVKQNRVLREARDLLLPRLVSGELDVSDLDLDGVLA